MTLTDQNDDTFASCLERAKHGDEYAWHALFRKVSGRVTAFLVARGATDPDGVAGETFLDIARSIKRFDGDERGFVAWSLTIAHRRLIDARRASSRRPEVMTDPADIEAQASTDVAETVLGLASATRARRLFAELTPDQADVLALRIYGELSMPEVAEQLGKPLTAVTALQHRGLERLRRLLEDSAG